MIPLTDLGDDVALPAQNVATANERKSNSRRKRGKVRPDDRRMIAWDGEGINLSGDDAPQHYVLFGCSARPDDPLVVTRPDGDLKFFDMADYMLETAARFPGAFHVGYAFGYDQNMIVKDLRWSDKRALYLDGEVWVRRDKDTRYKIDWVPSKKISITRIVKRSNGERETAHIKIEDIFSFYGSSFVKAYNSTFPNDAANDEAWRTIVAGKASRGGNKWEDMADVRRYWRYEIIALEKLATGLRDMLWDHGFYLKQWYGPGAFANYIRRTYNLTPHEWGGKEENLPNDSIHFAIKCAYYGGHFEQYQAGRVHGKVYGYDINSAYPAAFCDLPTMREGGFWQELSYAECQTDAENPSTPLTVYYVKFRNTDKEGMSFFKHKPMPLPWRDHKGGVSYTPRVEGWYWSPEVSAILNSRRWNNETNKLYIVKAYRWVPVEEEYPWRDVIEPMFQTRLELKRAGNPAQMVFKLGPNSLYGKMAQRVGFIESDDESPAKPPRAHTLCIAGFLTSWCRANILRMIDCLDDDQLIAVETDGIYSTAPPEQITERWPDVVFGKQLGEWGVDEYEDVVYLQNGVYLTYNGSEWTAKTRGYISTALPFDRVGPYLDTCEPKQKWAPLTVDNGTQFMKLGLAIMRATEKGNLISSHAANLHCRWFPDEKVVQPSGALASKRAHSPRHCPACEQGLTLGEGLHRLFIHQRLAPGGGFVSRPYRLPWETKEVEEWRTQIGGTEDRQSDVVKATRRKLPHNRPGRRSFSPADIPSSTTRQSPRSEMTSTAARDAARWRLSILSAKIS